MILMKEIREDSDLNDYTLADLPLLESLKHEFLSTPTEVCIERAKLVTEYMKNPEDPSESAVLRRAKAIRHYMRCREANVHDRNLLAGSSTSKLFGAPVYPELLGLTIWPELDTISTREENPQLLTKEEAKELNFSIFPYWLDRSLLEVTRKKLMKEGGQPLKALQLMEKIAFFMAGKSTVVSHTIPCFEEVLSKGLLELISEAREKATTTGLTGSSLDLMGMIDFYRAMQVAMSGVIAYAQNLSGKAQAMAGQTDDQLQRKHFYRLADTCAMVPARPAETFLEAVNALWLCNVGVLAENVNMAVSPGRLDQILYPYFRRDVEEGRITVEEALNIIGCLWFKIADNTNLVPASAEKLFGGAGSVPAVTLGGVDRDGGDAVNDLTYLMLKVTELLELRDPNVNARYHLDVNEPAYKERVSRVIVNTRAIPAIYSDTAIIPALENQGLSTAHARDFGVVGCVEPTSAGREYADTSAIILNLTAAMDMAIHRGKRPYITGDLQIGPETPAVEELASFEDFFGVFEQQLAALIDLAVSLDRELELQHRRLLPSPLLSSLFEGPMENARDLISGGALYNSSGATHVGFADTCDSLNAIEYAVYVTGQTTWTELKEALVSDFESDEALRSLLVNRAPKFGTDDSSDDHPVAVRNSQRLVKFLYDRYQAKRNLRGGKYRPAFWTMTNHAGLGKIGCALPSGRKAHEVFSSGITPGSQCGKDLTGAYLSVAKLGSKWTPGGVALNMKHAPVANPEDGEKYHSSFGDMFEGYFRAGGMQVQYNLYTYETLIDAVEHPEKYSDLVVRVSGYSAYFNDLNEAMKRELITRTQYGLTSGKAVPLP